MKSPDYVANFDSATAMLRAIARFLRGRSFAGGLFLTLSGRSLKLS